MCHDPCIPRCECSVCPSSMCCRRCFPRDSTAENVLPTSDSTGSVESRHLAAVTVWPSISGRSRVAVRYIVSPSGIYAGFVLEPTPGRVLFRTIHVGRTEVARPCRSGANRFVPEHALCRKGRCNMRPTFRHSHGLLDTAYKPLRHQPGRVLLFRRQYLDNLFQFWD